MIMKFALSVSVDRRKEWHWASLIGSAMIAMVLALGLAGCIKLDESLTDIYVSPTGDDKNPGTQAKPLATLAYALSKVASDARPGTFSTPPKGRTIFLDKGTHYVASTITLGAELSGAPGKPFTIAAVPGTQPVLSGARKLNALQWSTTGNGVWSTSTDGVNFDDLYINGERQVRARYPNFQPRSTTGARVFFNGSGNATAVARVARWRNPTTGYVHVMLNAEWGDIHYQIKGKNADGTLMLGEGTGNNRMEQGPNWGVSFVENIFEELDVTQEWFHDVAAKKLYFMPKAGIDLNAAQVEVSGGENNGLVEQLIVLKGSESAPIHDVVIKGLTLTQTGNTFMKTTEPLLRSDWKVFRGGAVYIEGAQDVEIVGNDMRALGGNAVFVSGYNRRVAVRGNEIKDVGASGILFVGSPDAVRSPGFHYSHRTSYANMDKTPGPKSNAYPSQSIAENNLIYDIGTMEKQATGVEISMASEITVRNNSIYGTPRAGINIGDGTWGGHVIEFNDVFDTVLETGDHGAFNSWGRDRYWGQLGAGNGGIPSPELTANPEMPFLDAMKPTTIRNNRFRCDHGWDIDLDDGSSNYVIENNLLLKGGLKNREGFRRINRNNILVNNTFHAHVWFPKSQDRFEKNIVMQREYSLARIGTNNGGELIDNNLVPMIFLRSLDWDIHSKFYDNLAFVAPEKGDFTLPNNSLATLVGFQNFPMDQFGVQDPRLKPKAKTPTFDKVDIKMPVFEAWSDFLGATVKSVETEGERSVGGLASVAGVIVKSVLPGSDAANSGVQTGDTFIRATVAGKVINIVDSNDLNAALGAEAPNGKMNVVVRRNNLDSPLTLNFPSLTVYNEDWSGISVVGSWLRSTNRTPSAGDYKYDVRYPANPSSYATITFTGTGIRVLTPLETGEVKFTASLDGAVAQDLTIPARSSYKGQRTAYSIAGLPYGQHTVVLKPVPNAGLLQIDRVDITK